MDDKPRKTIDRKWTNQQPVGFCVYKAHKGYLTIKMLKKHECLRKQCRCLKKLPHEFWDQREQIKQLRMGRKLRLKG